MTRRWRRLDPLTLVAEALAAGAGAGLKDSASDLVRLSYQELRAWIRDKLGRPVSADNVEVVRAELDRGDIEPDDHVLALARVILEHMAQVEAGARFVVDARRSHGVQIGDNGIQIIVGGNS